MNQDIERLLDEWTPRGPAPELRGRVLAAVEDALAEAPTPARRRFRVRPGLGVAAALLASLLMNHLVNTLLDRRLAAVLGPPPVPRQATEIAAEIAGLTDSRTGQWAFERLAASRSESADPQHYPVQLHELIRQVSGDLEEPSHETSEENPQVVRDLRGSIDHHPSGAQRLLRLEHRNRA
jgi:hypothetical protein